MPNVTERGKLCCVDLPNSELERSLVTLVRLTRLNRLKISPRIWRVAPSLKNQGIRFVLTIFKLTLARPGPSKVLRPRFPCWPRAGSGNAEAGKSPVMKSLRAADLLLPKEGVLGVS